MQDKNTTLLSETAQKLQHAEQERAASRFQRGMQALQNKQLNVLKNPEFAGQLCEYIYSHLKKDPEDDIQELFLKLFDIAAEDLNNEDAALQILLGIGEKSLAGSNIKILQILCDNYVQLSECRKIKEYVTDTFVQFLVGSVEIFIRVNLWSDFKNGISLLWKVRNITFSDAGETLVPYRDVFSRICTKDIMEKLLQYRLYGDEETKEFSGKVLSYFGAEATLYMLNRLIFSSKKEERLLLVGLFQEIGQETVEAIQQFMKEDLPWYAVRNLIIVIANTGKPEHYELIEGYLVHPDVRVQEQVVIALFQLAGDKLAERVVMALPVVDDSVKIKMAMQLIELDDEKIGRGLIDLLIKRLDEREGARDDVAGALCITLRSYPYPFVLEGVKRILGGHGAQQGMPQDAISKQDLLQTLQILEPKIRHRNKNSADVFQDNVEFCELVEEDLAQTDIEEFISDIKVSLLTGTSSDDIADVVYKKALQCIQARDFAGAKILRDELVEIKPDALPKAMRLSEMIEREKVNAQAMSQDDYIWNELKSKLGEDQYNALLNAFVQESYEEGERIASAGNVDASLYFLEVGAVKLTCHIGNRETFLKKGGPGAIFGARTFFAASIWTVDITAVEPTEMHALHREQFDILLKRYPTMEKKLCDFIVERENIRELIVMSGSDRREYARYEKNISIKCYLFDLFSRAGSGKVFNSDLFDISRGGLGFLIKIASKAAASKLLGRHIQCEISLKGGRSCRVIGTIVSIGEKDVSRNLYSVHVRFHEELTQENISDLINIQG